MPNSMIRDAFVSTRDRDDHRAALKAKYVPDRQAFELANMSPCIRREDYAACITQEWVAEYGALECGVDLREPVPAAALRVKVDFVPRVDGKGDPVKDQAGEQIVDEIKSAYVAAPAEAEPVEAAAEVRK